MNETQSIWLAVPPCKWPITPVNYSQLPVYQRLSANNTVALI